MRGTSADLAALKRANAAAGQFYFSPATEEFFGSRQQEAVAVDLPADLGGGRGWAYWEEQTAAPSWECRWRGQVFTADGRQAGGPRDTVTGASRAAVIAALLLRVVGVAPEAE